MARFKGPVTRSRWQKMTPRQHDTYERVRYAYDDFRDGLPIGEAAKRNKTTPETMERYLGVKFPMKRGRRVPVGHRSGYVMSVPATDGPRWMFVAGSRQQSRLGKHRSTIAAMPNDDGDSLRRMGEPEVNGVDVDSGQRLVVVLETDPDTIVYWQHRVPEFFLELYESPA